MVTLSYFQQIVVKNKKREKKQLNLQSKKQIQLKVSENKCMMFCVLCPETSVGISGVKLRLLLAWCVINASYLNIEKLPKYYTCTNCN